MMRKANIKSNSYCSFCKYWYNPSKYVVIIMAIAMLITITLSSCGSPDYISTIKNWKPYNRRIRQLAKAEKMCYPVTG